MRTARRVAVLLAVLICVGALGYVLGGLLAGGARPVAPAAPRPAGWHLATILAASLLSAAAALVVHELGHLAGGGLAGFRAYLLVVGPVRLERGVDGWYCRLNTDIGLAGGLAGSTPLDGLDLRRRTALFVAGGPVASAIAGACALAGLVWLGAPGSFGGTLVSSILLAHGATSLVVAAATLIPMRASGFLSDGARLLRLSNGGPVAERDTAIQAVVGASVSGVRPRDWDADLVAAALQPEDGSLFEAIGWQLAMCRAADAGRADEARVWLDRILAAIGRFPVTLQAGVRLDAARQLASWGMLDDAREHLAAATGQAIGAPYLRPAAEAALLAAEGRVDAALEKVGAARAALDQGIDRGGAAWLQDALDAIEARARLTPSGRSSGDRGSTGTATS